jgi:hypothetical protein
MSVARGFGINGFKYFTNVCKPIDINLNFIVDSTNGNGLGLRSLKSNGYVESVVMNTSSGAPAGPAAGYAWIHFKNNFNYYLGGFSGFVSPINSATVAINSTLLTIGQAYVITSLGTSLLADWNAIGLPAGFTPTIGQSFIAKATGAGAGSGLVSVPLVSGVNSVEVVGDPNQMINNSNIAKNAGAWVLVQFLYDGVLTPPANGSVVGMNFRFDGSSVTVDGL